MTKRTSSNGRIKRVKTNSKPLNRGKSLNRGKQNLDRGPEKLLELEGKTENQKDYIRAILENEIIFCSGPSGCGKSFIAAGIAAHHLHEGKIDQIIITRPLVCSGKDIGSLPGELNEKIHPYLKPMEENFKKFLGRSYYGEYFNSGKIRYEPLEVMRGSTFDYSYLVLDEAQNCTIEQLKLFITRMGKNSKVLINGDIKQTDLKSKSGLQVVIEKLKHIEGIASCVLTYGDIQRNGIIGHVLMALEE
jgi:phosphate starvation-inducible PhoH-like protein